MSHAVDIGRRVTLEEYDFLRSRGFIAVARYYNGSGGIDPKTLLTDEVAIALSRQLGIIPVFETTGSGPFTYAQGLGDGQAARKDALLVGQPLGTPICFAIDVDVVPSLVDYFNGAFDGLDGAYIEGVYGKYEVVKQAREDWGALGFFWQTYAWSSGAIHEAADVYQYRNDFEIRPGLTVDLNVVRSAVPWRLA